MALIFISSEQDYSWGQVARLQFRRRNIKNRVILLRLGLPQDAPLTPSTITITTKPRAVHTKSAQMKYCIFSPMIYSDLTCELLNCSESFMFFLDKQFICIIQILGFFKYYICFTFSSLRYFIVGNFILIWTDQRIYLHATWTILLIL